MANQLLGDIFGVASALIGVALIALLINKSSNTAQVINASAQGFNSLLDTVTLQNGMGISSGMTTY